MTLVVGREGEQAESTTQRDGLCSAADGLAAISLSIYMHALLGLVKCDPTNKARSGHVANV